MSQRLILSSPHPPLISLRRCCLSRPGDAHMSVDGATGVAFEHGLQLSGHGAYPVVLPRGRLLQQCGGVPGAEAISGLEGIPRGTGSPAHSQINSQKSSDSVAEGLKRLKEKCLHKPPPDGYCCLLFAAACKLIPGCPPISSPPVNSNSISTSQTKIPHQPR